MNKKKGKKSETSSTKKNILTKKIDIKNNKIKDFFSTLYIGYPARVAIFFLSFLISILLSMFFLTKTFHVEEAKVTNYQESGNLDYKVYLKPNEFYEQPFLGSGMTYIASIIKNISIDMNYRFIIEEQVNTSFSYKIMGKLFIGDSQGKKLYEKEYLLKEVKDVVINGQNIQNINDNISIDYDYYNQLANSFKSTFGVDATSKLIISTVVDKNIKNEEKNINLNGSNQMSLTIPLSQRTLEIALDNTSLNNKNSIVDEKKTSLGNIAFGVISAVLFIGSVACILKSLELLFLLIPKTSKYDKYIKKLLTEYDRLIVETPTEPRMLDKEIIKIKRFEELLDARDNLKRPIMYYNLVSHQKSYFYIEKENTMYLLTIKATDLEVKDENKKKR